MCRIAPAGITLLLSLACTTSVLGEAIPAVITKDGLQRGGQPYFIKGVGGDTRLAEMKAVGVNSFRTWSHDQLDKQLPEAEKHGLTVCAGIWLEPECEWFSYRKPEHCERQLKRVREIVRKHKDASALLFWGLGNESEGDGHNAAYWQQLDRLAQMVHKEDPAHPTFTALAGVSEEKAAGLNEHAPHLDFIGINTYGALRGLRTDLDKLGWARPWVVTEYGPQGFWERPKTSWGSPLEQTSTEKARTVEEGYRRAILPGARCLGGYAFLWGQKQEATATWFGLFTRHGEGIATLDMLEQIWTGRVPANTAPVVKELKSTANLGAIKPGAAFQAHLEAFDPNGDTLTYRWEVMTEAIKRDREGREIPVDPIPGCVDSAGKSKVEVTAPKQPGKYRLFGYALDGKGHAGTANVPFRVE
jgi:hypothetical protein